MSQVSQNRITDEELVLLAIPGNLAAFDLLVSRYRGAVVRIALQILGTAQEAEDAAQDALLIAYKALPQLQDPAHFPGWLYAITRRRALRMATSQGRDHAELSDTDRVILEFCPELTQNPAEAAIRGITNAGVRSAMQALPPDIRLVMELRWMEEWAVKQIASFLLLPETTVKWRLHAGRKALKRRLAPQIDADNEETITPLARKNIEEYGTYEPERNGYTAATPPAA